MTLEDWLTARRMSNAEFARLSGIGQRALVQKYRLGRQFPAAENLVRIRTATRGAVTANDFLDQRVGAHVPEVAASRRAKPRRKATAPPSDEPDMPDVPDVLAAE